ncbi:Nucleolar pre-ribosomal-associated protein 1 [Daphnia sinensis]|uniref:Nucleolar pre-ribosomal-associated protein 1 n=1 Tax=Daphnia sinensis TaxID=1820382 RepID=A0AAD5PYE6_9CRUS|nr:Nucleolar pre-ribosomal-associated protein 1 [Daphnia sinensis]
MQSPEKRKNPSDVEDDENEPEMETENPETCEQNVPNAGVKKRKRDLAWSFMEGLAGPEPFEALKRFIDAAEAFKAKEHGAVDIVKDFFQNGGTGRELLPLLDLPKFKTNEVTIVFNCLEILFQRMASDLTEYRDVGANIASSILKSNMDTIYRTMLPSSTATQIKSALRLLTTMVTLGHLTARAVITRVDFAHENLVEASQRKSLHDLPDVRSTFVMFITSFLLEEDSMLLRTISENPAILWPVFFHLQTLRDKVVMNPMLSKTLKFHIFKSSHLVQLMRLFHWIGPQKPKRIGKVDTAEEPPLDEALEEDKVMIAELLQSLLLSLTTSHKYGIAFPDYNLGVGSNTKNNLILEMLQNLFDFWAGFSPRIVEIQSQLVVKTIEKCPDLLDCYFRSIALEIDHIRMSVPWQKLSSVVKQIIEVQNLTMVFNPKEKHTVAQQALRAATLVGPLSLPRNFFTKGLLIEHSGIRMIVGEILQVIFTKINEFQNILMKNPKANMYSETEKKEIFLAFKKKISWQVPKTSKLIIICREMPTFKNQVWYGKCWLVLLDLLVNYAKFGWIPEEEQFNFPAAEMVEAVMECDNDFSINEELLQNLKLAIFTLISSLSHLPKMREDQINLLVFQLSSCLKKDIKPELRLCVGSLLLKLANELELPHLHLSSTELYIWTSTLERHSEATEFFAKAFSSFLTSSDPYDQEYEYRFSALKTEKQEQPCSQLILTAWNCMKQSGYHEPISAYIAAVMCDLILSQKGDPKAFANVLSKAAPRSLSSRSALASFLKSWTKKKAEPADISTVGLDPTSVILYNCCFPNELDWTKLKTEWESEIAAKRNRLDIVEVAFYQCLTCLSLSATRKSAQLNILSLLRILVDGEVDGSGYPFRVKLLEDPRTLQWFDLMNTRDSYIVEFNSLVQDSLKLVQDHRLDQLYQRKLNDSIASVIQGEGSLEEIDEDRLLLSLSELKINEIEPQIQSLVHRLTSSADDVCLRYLNVFLQLAGRLRLEGVMQRISWSVFSQALKLFVSFEATPILKKGIYDVVSVCPEFLDAIDDFTAVLNACLKSKWDYTSFCHLLVTSSSQLCTAFGQWCLGHKKRLKDINWRLQIVPAYLANAAADDKVLDTIHRYISPALKQLLVNRSDFLKVCEETPKLTEFLGVLIPKRWTVEDCHELATQLLSCSKKGFSCSQFVEAGRHGTHYDLHAKLCLHATVRQFKSENPEPREVEQLTQEFDWLAKQTQADLPTLAKSIVEDDVWSKFLKYTLRIGLRALTVSESPLPPLALGLMTNVWHLLLAGQGVEVATASLKVHEMIISHSEFMTVIMDERETYTEQKKAVLQLLAVLIQVNPKICQGSQVPLLLSSYHATRSTSDQLILGLLRTYEKNGVVLSTFKPYLWGPAAAAHYSIQRGVATRIAKLPEAAEVLTLLNSKKLLQTAYNFPIELRLNGMEITRESEDYDPRFTLLSLVHILSSQYDIQCGRFSQSGAISLLFATLSSPCSDMRSLGWLGLRRLYDQLQSSTAWPERCLWIHLINCVRYGSADYFRERFNGARQVPPKLPNIIALFLAKAAAIIRDPSHPMYRSINNFLLVKSAMDVTQVPEFFVMLHNTELPEQRAIQRNFLFNLLRDGIKSRQDYLVCARRRVFRILLSLQPSKLLTDASEKRLILEIVQSSLQNSIIAYDLIQHRGLIMWLDSLLLADTVVDEPALMVSVVATMWDTLYSHMQKKRTLKDDKEANAKLEDEVAMMEAEDEGDGKRNSTSGKPTGGNKTQPAKANSRKPIWDQLPMQHHVIPPWIMCELMQLLVSLWHVIYKAEPNFDTFNKYVRVLCAAGSHVHESRKLIHAAQEKDTKAVRFVTPPGTLTVKLMRQIVEVSSRFVSKLPDLKDHLAVVESSKTQSSVDAVELNRNWERRHSYMRDLMNHEELNTSTRCDVHMLLSLAECGI